MESNDFINTRRKIPKLVVLAMVFLFFVSLVFCINYIWEMSGSNKWELEIDNNGIQIYSLKPAGSGLKKIKGKVRVKASLSSIVDFFQDQSTCEEFGCLEAKILQRVNSQLYYSTFKYPAPSLFKAREFVVKSQFYQDHASKEVHYYHVASPADFPVEECCHRVTHFYVLWRFIPVGNGEVDIEMMRDIDLGGAIPHFLLNKKSPKSGYKLLSKLQGFLDREKYKNANYDFIQEL